MIKHFLLILGIFISYKSIGQVKPLAKFIITDATNNNQEMTEDLLEQNAYTVFYTTGHGDLNMANVWPKEDSQSYGRLYASKSQKIKETYESYQADVMHFKWRYINNYDSNKGTASIKLIKIYKPQGVAFVLTIITESLDVIVYKGYMEGTLDFSEFGY